nr:MAG TPA: hypothetical protein [Caudoviricetes sp.]
MLPIWSLNVSTYLNRLGATCYRTSRCSFII